MSRFSHLSQSDRFPTQSIRFDCDDVEWVAFRFADRTMSVLPLGSCASSDTLHRAYRLATSLYDDQDRAEADAARERARKKKQKKRIAARGLPVAAQALPIRAHPGWGALGPKVSR